MNYRIGACEVTVTKASPAMPYAQYHLAIGDKRFAGQLSVPSVADVLQAASNAKRDGLITEAEKSLLVRSLNGQRNWGTRLVSVDIDAMTGSQTGRGGGKFLEKRPVRSVAIEEDVAVEELEGGE